jgi:tRNA(fMet)-specific endonuclease VapC
VNTILLDTNAYSRYAGGDTTVAEYITDADIVYLSTVVIGELYAGFFSGTKYEENIRELYTFLSRSYCRIVDVTLNTSALYGALWTELRRKGCPLPTNDIWIAAHGIETDSMIITYDTHFLHIVGIRLWDELRDV